MLLMAKTCDQLMSTRRRCAADGADLQLFDEQNVTPSVAMVASAGKYFTIKPQTIFTAVSILKGLGNKQKTKLHWRPSALSDSLAKYRKARTRGRMECLKFLHGCNSKFN